MKLRHIVPAGLLVLTACGGSSADDSASVTDPPSSEAPPVSDATVETLSTEAPVTEPPATDPPVTDPPVTDPPVTEPASTEPPPVTEPPATAPPVTEPATTDAPGSDTPPAEDCDAVLDETKGSITDLIDRAEVDQDVDTDAVSDLFFTLGERVSASCPDLGFAVSELIVHTDEETAGGPPFSQGFSTGFNSELCVLGLELSPEAQAVCDSI